jgi:hypothetical protein
MKEVEKLKKQEEERMEHLNELLRNQEMAKKKQQEYKERQKIKEEKNLDLNHSNMENADTYSTMKRSKTGFYKTRPQVIQMTDGGQQFLKEIDDSPERLFEASVPAKFKEENFDIVQIILKKFNHKEAQENDMSRLPSARKRPQTAQTKLSGSFQSSLKQQKERGKELVAESFFTQQIHVQPPEGYNASVAAPLAPGSGWAPSIPSGTQNLDRTSL